MCRRVGVGVWVCHLCVCVSLVWVGGSLKIYSSFLARESESRGFFPQRKIFPCSRRFRYRHYIEKNITSRGFHFRKDFLTKNARRGFQIPRGELRKCFNKLPTPLGLSYFYFYYRADEVDDICLFLFRGYLLHKNTWIRSLTLSPIQRRIQIFTNPHTF